MQFVVTALDYTDAGALQRRMDNREVHLERLRAQIEAGRILSAGAILDDAGNMIGSSLHLDFPDRASLDQALAQDPYSSGKVWEKIEVRPIKLVPIAR